MRDHELHGRAVALLDPAHQLADGRLRVVTTTSLIADLARQIGGDDVSVESLMGPGVDPHLYRARESDV